MSTSEEEQLTKKQMGISIIRLNIIDDRVFFHFSFWKQHFYRFHIMNPLFLIDMFFSPL